MGPHDRAGLHSPAAGVQKSGPCVFRLQTGALGAASPLQARVRLRLGTSSWTGAGQNVTTSWQVFQSLAPSVSALSGSVTNVPTAGTVWPNVGIAKVKYMEVCGRRGRG